MRDIERQRLDLERLEKMAPRPPKKERDVQRRMLHTISSGECFTQC